MAAKQYVIEIESGTADLDESARLVQRMDPDGGNRLRKSERRTSAAAAARCHRESKNEAVAVELGLLYR